MEIQVLTIPVKSTISVRMGGCVWCVCGYMRQVVLVYKCVQGHVLLLKVNTNRQRRTDRQGKVQGKVHTHTVT